MGFFTTSVTGLKTVVTAIGAGVGVWGVINLLEGYGMIIPVQMLICGKEAKANRQQSLLFRSKRNMVEMFISLCYTIIRI